VRALRQVTGRVAVLDRADVDTDQIVPKQFLKRIERTGYGEFLFYDWMKEPGFELSRPEAEGASILVAGRNFGCGSSREHAPWALEDYGFRAILAPSFGDIFRTNCAKIGLAAVVLAADELHAVRAAIAEENELTVDMEALEIRHPGGLRIAFQFDPFQQHCIVEGLDDVGLPLQRAAAIDGYERAYRPRFDTRAVA
jgi:3-isopropylmalate/(R)-2-methylmalate dehydratase small subunit